MPSFATRLSLDARPRYGEAMSKDQSTIVMALIGRAQGLRGEVRATSYAEDPLSIGAYGPLSANGRSFKVTAVRPVPASPNQVVLKLAGIDNRTDAEALNGVQLTLPRAALPPLADEDDFYHEDLIGLAVRDAAGETLATIAAVHNFGAGDMLELRLAGGRAVYVPFSKAAVPHVDVAGGFVTVDPAAAGLLSSPDDEAREEDAAKASRGGADGAGI